MTLPQVIVRPQDGALGILPPSSEAVHAKIGVASAGGQNEVVVITSPQQVRDIYQGGPLADALAIALARGASPILAIRATASTAGQNSTVTRTGGTGTGTLAITGTPLDSYQGIVEITRAGSVAGGDAAFRYTLDGGDTWSAEIALAATYLIPGTGLTLEFTDGLGPVFFEVGDKFTWTSTAPAMTLTDLQAAIDVLAADPRDFAFLHVVGTATPTIAAAVATRMAEFEAAHRYAFALLEARDIDATTDSGSHSTWLTNLTTEWNAFTDVRVGVIAGHAEITSRLTGRVHRRSLAWPYTGWLAALTPETHPGEFNLGPVPGISVLYHDEETSPSLDAAGFTTFRTHPGQAGFYVTRGRLKTAPTSDYQRVQNRRVIDKACRITRTAALRFLNSPIRVDDAGLIAEPEAQRIEGFISGALEGQLISPGNATRARVVVKRDSNILSTSRLDIEVRIVPFGYAEEITVEIGFENPALA